MQIYPYNFSDGISKSLQYLLYTDKNLWHNETIPCTYTKPSENWINSFEQKYTFYQQEAFVGTPENHSLFTQKIVKVMQHSNPAMQTTAPYLTL